MRRKLAFLEVAFAVVIAVLAFSASAQAADSGIVASATGAGHITVGGELRTFSFTAEKDSSNNSRGQAELFNRSTGIRVHLGINCLNVVGNVATMSGTVTDSTASGEPVGTGNPIWFQVVDNGEGQNAPPDLISLVFFFFGPPGVPCSSPLVPASIPVEGGNIQVH